MPIDPDAYMAGAIPTISRSDSWAMESLQPRYRHDAASSRASGMVDSTTASDKKQLSSADLSSWYDSSKHITLRTDRATTIGRSHNDVPTFPHPRYRPNDYFSPVPLRVGCNTASPSDRLGHRQLHLAGRSDGVDPLEYRRRTRAISGGDSRLHLRQEGDRASMLPRAASFDHLSQAIGVEHVLEPLTRRNQSASSFHLDVLPQNYGRGNEAKISSHPLTGSPGSPYRKLTRPVMTRHQTSDGTLRRALDQHVPVALAKRPRYMSALSPSRDGGHLPPISPSMPSAQVQSVFDTSTLLSALPRIRSPSNPENRTSFKCHTPVTDDEAHRYHHARPAGEPSMCPHRQGAFCRDPPQTGVISPDYIPPGFAKPTRPLEWNRDGPAMKTYGIAWKRRRDDLVLPRRLAGPRYVQAKPPQTAV